MQPGAVGWVGLSALVLVFVAGAPCVQAKQLRRPVSQGPMKQVTRASWYGKHFQGRRTAGGSVFNPQRLTAAHRTLGFGSKVKVTELGSGRSVVVQITDRGPFLPGRGIDLSYAAARQLGIVHRGVARVKLEPVVAEPEGSTAPVVTAFYWPTPQSFPKAIVQ